MAKGVAELQCDCDQNKEVTDLPQCCSGWLTAWCLSENWLSVVHKEISTEMKNKCLETLTTISHSCDIHGCNQWTCLMELSIEQKYKSVKHWWGKPNGSFTRSLRGTALNRINTSPKPGMRLPFEHLRRHKVYVENLSYLESLSLFLNPNYPPCNFFLLIQALELNHFPFPLFNCSSIEGLLSCVYKPSLHQTKL